MQDSGIQWELIKIWYKKEGNINMRRTRIFEFHLPSKNSGHSGAGIWTGSGPEKTNSAYLVLGVENHFTASYFICSAARQRICCTSKRLQLTYIYGFRFDGMVFNNTSTQWSHIVPNCVGEKPFQSVEDSERETMHRTSDTGPFCWSESIIYRNTHLTNAERREEQLCWVPRCWCTVCRHQLKTGGWRHTLSAQTSTGAQDEPARRCSVAAVHGTGPQPACNVQ